MKCVQTIWFMCILSLYAHSAYGESNVWLQTQNNTQHLNKQSSRYESPSDPNSLPSPYFYHQYVSDNRSVRVPLTLSDQELWIYFVAKPTINVKATLESENLFFWIPDDFKCRYLIPSRESLQTNNYADSLYAPYDSCLSNLPQPLLRSEQPTFTLISELSNEDVQLFLTLHPVQPWQVYRRFKSSDDEVLKQIDRLRQNPDIDKVWEVFYPLESVGVKYPALPLDRVTVLFQENVSQTQISALNVQYGTEILQETKGVFSLKIHAGGGLAALDVTEALSQDLRVLVVESYLWWWEPAIEYTPTIYEIYLSEGRFRIDFNKDGVPDFEDFTMFATGFGSRIGEKAFDSRLDLNDDNQINFADFILFAQRY